MVRNSHSAADVQFLRMGKTGPGRGRDPDLPDAGEGQDMVALAQ
jgi:hypothetical protein